MELKELLGEDLFKQVEGKLNGHSVIIAGKDEKFIKDDGNWIPKTRFQEVIEQKNTYKETNEELSKQLNSLKTQLKGNEEVEKQITQLQNDLKDRDDKVTLITKKFALKDSIRESGAKYPDLLLTKFDLSKIELTEEGKVKGYDDLLKPIKEQYPDLFGNRKVAGVDDGKTNEPPKIQLSEGQKREAYQKFPYMEKGKAEEAWYDVLKRTGKIK